LTTLAHRCTVTGVREVADNIHVLSFQAPAISSTVQAGQFLSIRVEDSTDPLLRRPFSVYRTEGSSVEIIFNVIGRGTALLKRKRAGEELDVLGPLGVPFSLSTNDFATAILVGGGLGIAPLPLATAHLLAAGKRVETFLGARSGRNLTTSYLRNVHVATDDGSQGYHGTVVDLLRASFKTSTFVGPKLFACGPTPMLRAVAAFVMENDLLCDVSLEGPMGCGIGICQGCPVPLADGERKFALMCKEGPTFDVRKVRL
jgi:dihydroorotate dehydrogenase electron transfer subunit